MEVRQQMELFMIIELLNFINFLISLIIEIHATKASWNYMFVSSLTIELDIVQLCETQMIRLSH